jgi:soluble lytic murein transglycosylase
VTESRLHYFSYWLSWLFLGFLTPGLAFYDFSSVQLPNVDDKARLGQAREILGVKFNSSVAQKFKNDAGFSYRIHEKVQNSLPPKWQGEADRMTEFLITESEAQGLDPIFILAVIQTESSFNPETVGSAGEIGLMQILPATAEWISETYDLPLESKKMLFDPVTNLRFGITYFSHLRTEFDGSPRSYITAYNMGSSNVRKFEKRKKKMALNNHYLRRGYAARVLANYNKIYREIDKKKSRQLAGSLAK